MDAAGKRRKIPMCMLSPAAAKIQTIEQVLASRDRLAFSIWVKDSLGSANLGLEPLRRFGENSFAESIYRLPRGRFTASRPASVDSFCAGARRISLFSFFSRSNSAIH
jgi:hypothetical protein